jgi:acetyl-CoA synthetase
MSEAQTAPKGATITPDPDFAAKAHVSSLAQYEQMYKQSIEDPDTFWGDIANQFHWEKKWDTVRDYQWGDEVSSQWFVGGKTNLCYNCLDVHLEKRGDQTAILWEGNEPGVDDKLTYNQLHEEVCKFSNVLKNLGVQKGDRICIYIQMIPQAALLW